MRIGVNIMNAKNKKLIKQQLDTTLERFKSLKEISPPQKGWIRAIRDALGMSGKQFAERLGVKPPRISALENDEVAGAATIKTMKRAAESLGCLFVYGIVPRTSLDDIIKEQARLVARKRMARVSQTMLLEDQQLTEEEKKRALDDEIEKLISTIPRSLWNKY